MDTSKEYILMCEKAEEIQKDWKARAFDIFRDIRGIIRTLAEDYGCEFKTEGITKYDWEKEVVWLPRQDQLFKILTLKKHDNNPWNKITAFYFWLQNSDVDYKFEAIRKFSIEKLLLMFVMKHNFNKIYNDAKGYEMWVEDFREK